MTDARPAQLAALAAAVVGAASQDPDAHFDPREGHLWTINVTIRGAHGIRGPGDAEAHDHQFSDYESDYRPVQVQAFDLREALRRAAEVPLSEWLHTDEDGAG